MKGCEDVKPSSATVGMSYVFGLDQHNSLNPKWAQETGQVNFMEMTYFPGSCISLTNDSKFVPLSLIWTLFRHTSLQDTISGELYL